MKTHVVKTTLAAPVGEVVDLMDIYQINSMPVVDDEGQIRGVISENDVLRTILADKTVLEASCSSREFLEQLKSEAGNLPASAIMSPSVITIAEHADAADAAYLLLRNDYTRLPVVNSTGQLVGTVNRIDIFQALFENQFQAGRLGE